MLKIYLKCIAKVLISIICLIPALSLAEQLPAQTGIPLNKIDKIVVFGDSLSDTANLYKLTYGTYPPSPPYFNGRCSSGYLWIEWFAHKLNLLSNSGLYENNWAYAGSKVLNSQNANGPTIPSMSELVTSYLFNLGLFPPTVNNHLYVIWDGSNDYISDEAPNANADALTTDVVNALRTQIQILIDLAHAKYFFIPNIVDLGAIPMARQNPNISNYSQILTNLAEMHNQKLKTMLDKLALDNAAKGVIIVQYDIFAAFKETIAAPPAGVTNVTDPCYTGGVLSGSDQNAVTNNSDTALKNKSSFTNNAVLTTLNNVKATATSISQCSNPSAYLFWDSVHPTAITHNYIAEKAYNALLHAAAPGN